MRRKDREVTDIAEIDAIIAKADVCRVALCNENVPYIVVMNFGYIAGNPSVLYFHCANKGRKLDMLEQNSYVCFEMDIDHKLIGGQNACDCGMDYSSVIGYGNLYVVANEAERNTGLNAIMQHYTGRNDYAFDTKIMRATTILRLDVATMNAKQRITKD